MEACLDMGIFQGGVGTPVHGVQDVGAVMEECLEMGVIRGGVGTPHGAVGGVFRGGSDPEWSWDSCIRSPRCRSRWESSWMRGSNPCLSQSVKKMINIAKRETFPASS